MHSLAKPHAFLAQMTFVYLLTTVLSLQSTY